MAIRNRFSQVERRTNDTQGQSLTKQSFAQDADANTIVNRHLNSPGRVGRNLGNVGRGDSDARPLFLDLTAIDYHSMLNKVQDVDTAFRRLPARIRTRFHNDPAQVIRFAEDPANLKEAVKLGLIQLPEGHVMTPEGDIIEQTDLTAPPQEPAPSVPPQAPKPDDEANPTFAKKGGEK